MNTSRPIADRRIALAAGFFVLGCGLAYLDRRILVDWPLLLVALPLAILAGWSGGLWSGCAFAFAAAGAGLLFEAEFRPPAAWRAISDVAILITVAVLSARLRAAQERERRLERLDPLTGLENSRSLAERLESERNRAQRTGRPVTVAYFDCNDFKALNDTRGHLAGDAALKAMAGVLKWGIRSYDAAARVGGDEFVLLLPEADADTAHAVIERVRGCLTEAMQTGGWNTTFSVGAVTFERMPDSSTEMLRAADELMYEVKRGARAGIAYRVANALTAGDHQIRRT